MINYIKRNKNLIGNEFLLNSNNSPNKLVNYPHNFNSIAIDNLYRIDGKVSR